MEENKTSIENNEYDTHQVPSKKIISKYDKRQLKKNLIKFWIGTILLLASWIYIQEHPAEKVSIFSGFEVIFQKAEIFLQNQFGKHWELLERKYSMEKYYKELIKMAENNKCINVDVIKEIQDTYHRLKDEKNSDLESVMPDYTKKAYEYDNIVKDNNC